MELIKAQLLLAQIHILIEGRKIVVNGFDQIIVNLNGDLVLIEAVCKRAFVLAGISKELKLLNLTCEHCRRSIAELVVATIQLLKRRFTQDAIMPHKHWNV